MRYFVGVWVMLALVHGGMAGAQSHRPVEQIKAEIITVAESFVGQGDEDFSRQKRLNVLVEELLAANPQPPVAERLPLLHGAWYQVWGPYDYRDDDSRGVDPKTNVDAIWQVILPSGYYYNVMPYEDDERITLLKGEYELVEGHPEYLRARFVAFPGHEGLPEGMQYWELPALAEQDALPNEITIVPRVIVWLFFGGGYLREAYTDETLRITYGGDDLDDRSDEYIYVMTREG